jgi:hypothetical protein
MKPIALLLLIVLAACGGSGNNPPSDSTECHNDAVTGARVCTNTKGSTK